MDMYLIGIEAYNDRTKMDEYVARSAKRFFQGRAEPATLECWARDAVAELWNDDVRLTRFIPALALRDVGARVAEAERGRPSSR